MSARNQVRIIQFVGIVSNLVLRLLHHFRGHKNVCWTRHIGIFFLNSIILDHLPIRHGHCLRPWREIWRGVPLCMCSIQDREYIPHLHWNLLGGADGGRPPRYCLSPLLRIQTIDELIPFPDPITATTLRRSLSVLHVPNSLWSEVHTFRERHTPRPQAR